MKLKILKKHNNIIAFLLSILGVGGACFIGGCEYVTPVEYGTPTATFKVYGAVTSEDNAKIPNVRVVIQSDTVYTDANGDYNVQAISFPDGQDFLVEFKDIDETVNGIYQSIDTIVSFEDPQFENANGTWNEGETSKKLNIKLKAVN